ncbi:uncharacterized protein LOC134275411 [Saccostrea cucullata]|uniref:uncharacterized protein LOC134275411 n=1 Tax=Saccostrea cuccullata TaxID=36930 RepID=UPI002ED56F93
MAKVLVVGHSFIRRLERSLGQIEGCFNNLGLDLSLCTVYFYGISGGRLDSLEVDSVFIEKLRTYGPDIIVIQLGGNDMSMTAVRPEVFACRLIEWVSSLTSRFCFIKNIVVCELFIRAKPRQVSVEMYESKRRIVNQMLKDMLEDYPNLTFWRHLRLMQSPLAILCGDGVHLSVIGTKKFYRSLRLAVLHAIRS